MTETAENLTIAREELLSKVFPRWTGAEEVTEAELNDWLEVAFRDCTLCERCVINCPLAVETPQLLGAAHGVLTALGKRPGRDCHLSGRRSRYVSRYI